LTRRADERLKQFLQEQKKQERAESGSAPLGMEQNTEVVVQKPALVTPGKGKRKALEMGSRARSRARVRNDELGKIIRKQSELFVTKDWRSFVHSVRGRGDLQPDMMALQNHSARRLIKHLAEKGAPVVLTTAPWSESQIESTLKRGPHKSCRDHLDFLREEILDFVRKGFWTLLPYRLWKKKMKAEGGSMRRLRLAPPGIVPQRERRPRLIVDYTFYYLNQDTLELAPEEAMQFGRALERVLYRVRYANPRYGPVYLGKVDLADGFCRVWLMPDSIPQLAVTFPKYKGEEQLIGLPLTLPMGWKESVPYFCAATETVTDIANHRPKREILPVHPLEHLALTAPEDYVTPAGPQLMSAVPQAERPAVSRTLAAEPRRSNGMQETAVAQPSGPKVLRPLQKPTQFYDVYLDDLIYGTQGRWEERVRHVRRLLHSVDSVFRPVDESDSPYRKHVPSTKKLLKGDGYPATLKVILGWLVNTVRQTLELPAHRQQRLREIFDYLRGRTRVTLSTWHKVLGELRSMSIGIPGSRGLFSLLQNEVKYADKGRIRLTPGMIDQIADFEHLANSLAERPTSLAELVPDHPVAIGPHDASGQGMGGVWLPAISNSNLGPTLWRARFPAEISSNLVSWENPTGTITNSDLELAGCIAHQDVLLQTVNCAGRTVLPLGDNTPSVSWHLKGSTSTTGPAAYLLRLNSLHQRHFRYLARAGWIAGPVNQMADDCSRLWRLSDSQLLAYFNLTYPQEQSWTLAHLRPSMHSALTLALQRKRPSPQSFLNEPVRKMVTGKHGKSSYPLSQASIPTLPSLTENTSYVFSKFSPRVYDAASSPPAANLSEVARWRTTYAPSVRRSPSWLTPATPGMVTTGSTRR